MGQCCSSVFDNYIINKKKTDCQIETINSFKPNRILLQRALIENNHKKIMIKTIIKNPFSSYEKILLSLKKESVKKLKTSEELNSILNNYANCSTPLNELCYRTDSISKQFDNALTKIIEKEETFEEEVEQNKTRIVTKELNFDDENKIRELFDQHFLFTNLNEDLFQYILKEIILIHVDKDKYLFEEGFPWNYLCLVSHGQVELLKSKERIKLFSDWDCFGYLSLFYSNLNTIFESNDFSLKCVEKAKIYLLDGETFQFIQAQRLKYKMEQYFYFTRRISAFQSLNNISKYKVTIASHLKEYHTETELNSKHAYLVKEGKVFAFKKDKEIKRFTMGQIIKINTLLFGKEFESEANNNYDQLKVMECTNHHNGDNSDNNNSTNYSINILTKNQYSKQRCPTLTNNNYSFNISSNRSCKITNNTHVPQTNLNSSNTKTSYVNDRTLCYELSKTDLEWSLGKNFKNEILFSMFSKYIRANFFFSNLFPLDKLYEIFLLFELKKYEPNESIARSSIKGNQRIILLLEGNLINEITHEYISQKGDIIGNDLIKNNSEINKQIIALTHCITLECEVNTISKYFGFDILNKSKRKDLMLLQILRKIKMFMFLSHQTLMLIKNKMQKQKFKSGEEILFNDEHKSLWVITKGKIKFSTEKDGVIKETEAICSFGETQILTNDDNNNNNNKSYSAFAQDKVTGYRLSLQHFQEIFNSNNKLCLYMQNCIPFDDQKHERLLNEIYYIKTLGKAKYGNVYLVHDNKQQYALKVITRILADKDKRNLNIPYQRRIMLLVNHPFIIKTYTTFRNERFCYFLSEYINGQNLHDYIIQRQTSNMNYINIIYDQFRFYLGSMFLVVKYLKQRNIVHRDLSLKSFIIDSQGYLKLIDFASAKFIKDYACSVVGEPMYCSPEMIKGRGYSSSCDYWSIGICGYMLLYNKYPFLEYDIRNPIQLYQSIVNDDIKYPKEWEGVSDDVLNKLKDIENCIRGLLCKNVNKRTCSLHLIKELELFKDYDFHQLLEFKIKAPYIPTPEQEVNNNKEIKYLEYEDGLIKNAGKDSFDRIELWQCDCRWADEF